MQKTIAVTVPEEMVPDLEELAREEGCGDEEVILDVLRRHLLIRRIRLMREEMIPEARKQGILTDQDVFDRVS
jgi:hypothetical protein